MKASRILNSAILIGQYLFGNKREYRQVILQNNGLYKYTLPIPPRKYQVKTAQNNKNVELLDSGEYLIFGNSRLLRLSFESFLPHPDRQYPFVQGDYYEPTVFINAITNWRKSKTPVRVIITQSDINALFAIERFDYNERDFTNDVYYSIEFTEIRDLNINANNNLQQVDSLTGLRMRENNSQTTDQISQLVSHGTDIFEKSRYAGLSIEAFKSKNNITSLTKSIGRKNWSF